MGTGLRLFFDPAGPRSHDAIFRLHSVGLAAGGAEPDARAQSERVAGPVRDAGRHAAGGEPFAADRRADGGAGGTRPAVDRSGSSGSPYWLKPSCGGPWRFRRPTSNVAAWQQIAAKCPKRCGPVPTSSSVRPWSAGNRKRERCGCCARRSCIRASGSWQPRRWPAPPRHSTNWIATTRPRCCGPRSPGRIPIRWPWPKRRRDIWGPPPSAPARSRWRRKL